MILIIVIIYTYNNLIVLNKVDKSTNNNTYKSYWTAMAEYEFVYVKNGI
jgi:hypothetical protein